MPSATFNKFNSFSQYLVTGKVNVASDTFKVMLTNTAPVATNAVYSDISGAELANGAGYTTGGTAASYTSDTDTSGETVVIFGNVVFTSSGSMGPFRYAVFYDSSASTKALVGWWDYGSSITPGSGETFTWTPDGVNGVFNLQ